MIRTAALPHRVTIERWTDTTTDAHGNEVRALASTLDNVPAKVDPAGTDEDLREGDQATERFTVFLKPTIAIDAEDRIIFDGRPLQVEGPPRRFDTTTPHHLEVTAHLIRG